MLTCIAAHPNLYPRKYYKLNTTPIFIYFIEDLLLVRPSQKTFICQERTRIRIQIRCSRHKYVLLRHSSKRRICKYEDVVV